MGVKISFRTDFRFNFHIRSGRKDPHVFLIQFKQILFLFMFEMVEGQHFSTFFPLALLIVLLRVPGLLLSMMMLGYMTRLYFFNFEIELSFKEAIAIILILHLLVGHGQ